MARLQVPLSAGTERALAALTARRNDCIVSLSGHLARSVSCEQVGADGYLLLVASPPRAGLVTQRQTFVRRYHCLAVVRDLRRSCGSKKLSAEVTNSPKKKRPGPLELGGEPGRGLSLQSGSNIGLVRSACGRDVGGGESQSLSHIIGPIPLSRSAPFRGFVRLRQRFVR